VIAGLTKIVVMLLRVAKFHEMKNDKLLTNF